MEFFSLLGVRSDEIVKFISSSGIFSLLLKNGCIVHFTPDDPYIFQQWLNEKGVENIKPLNNNKL